MKNTLILALAVTFVFAFGCVSQKNNCDGHNFGDTWYGTDKCLLCSCSENGTVCPKNDDYYTCKTFEAVQGRLCEQITNLNKRDSCYYIASRGPNATVLCDKISNQSIRATCMAMIIGNKACDELPGGEGKNNCYESLAIVKNDTAYCYNVTYKSSWLFEKNTDYCFQTVAHVNNNIKACEKIQDEEISDWCYTVLSFRLNDSNLCSKIFDNKTRDQCLNSFVKNSS